MKTVSIIKYFATIAIIFFSLNSIAQKFTSDELHQIELEVFRLLEDYQKYSGLTMDGQSLSKEYNEKLQGLFRKGLQSKVYNDIETKKTSGKHLSLQLYIKRLEKLFPSGVSVKLDLGNASISPPQKFDKPVYMVKVSTVKSLSGINWQNKLIKSDNEVDLYIQFKKVRNTLSDFAIYEVRKHKTSSIWAGIHATPALTQIYNSEIANSSYWESTSNFSYEAGVDIILHFTDNIGIMTGVGVSNYSNTFALKDYVNRNLDNKMTDQDNDSYYRWVEAEIEETDELQYLDIPIALTLRSTKPNKINFYVQAGVKYSILLSGNCEVTGNSVHSGYYPKYHIELYDVEQYEFTDESIQMNEEWDIAESNLSAYAALGMSIPLGYYMNLNFGPSVTWGISDLKYEKSKYRDDIVDMAGSAGNTTTRAFGFGFGITYMISR